jgi:hypothetical protein
MVCTGYISPLSRLNEEHGMHFWVSEWNTLTNDPYRVMLVQDTLWARGPLRDQPEPVAQLLVAVAPPNEAEPIAAQDRDRFPLPAGYYGAPLDGPEESSSNLAGNEPQHSKDGLTRRQEAIGVPGSCVYNATKQAATVAEAAREVAEEAAERERGTAASLRNQIDELRREVDAARVHATAERTASAAAEVSPTSVEEPPASESLNTSRVCTAVHPADWMDTQRSEQFSFRMAALISTPNPRGVLP